MIGGRDAPWPAPPAVAAPLPSATLAAAMSRPAGSDPARPAPPAACPVPALIAQHRPLLRAWLRLQVGDGADLDDLEQDVAVGLWEAAAAYDPARPFAAWMIGFARNHVLRWRGRRARERRLLPLDEEAHRALDAAAAEAPAADALRAALDRCLERMDAASAALLRWRFAEDLDLDGIAGRIRASVATASRRLARLLKLIEGCVRRRLEGG